jgi:hypothetical protein
MIPDQLHEYDRLIRLEPESKAPAVSPEGPFYSATDRELQNWIEDGGNVGLNLGELVALDIDTNRFRQVVEDNLPNTFTVKTGSGGEHRYYRSKWSGKRQFTDGKTDLGSVRSGNWYTVIPPSIHDETGNQYTVLHDRPIQPVPELQIQDFLTAISEESDSQHSGGGGGGGGGCVGGSSIPEIPSEYPNQSAEWPRLRSWLSANGLLYCLSQTTNSDWSGVEFKLAKCLAEGGFSDESISEVLNRLSVNSKWHNRGQSYRHRTVRKAIVAACNDDYVDFSNTDDMEAEASESRKTEPGSEGTRHKGGENTMPEFTDKETAQVKEGSSDGDRVIEAVRVEGKDGNDSFEFVSLRKGRVKAVELTNGEEGQIIDVDETGKSVGGTADLELVIEALQELHEEIN